MQIDIYFKCNHDGWNGRMHYKVKQQHKQNKSNQYDNQTVIQYNPKHEDYTVLEAVILYHISLAAFIHSYSFNDNV